MAELGYIGANTDLILGREFLTWLWYKSEQANGMFRTSDARSNEVYHLSMEQRIVVRGGDGDNVETATVTGTLSPMREARLGLTIGKFVVSAVIRLENDGVAWQMSLKAEDFGLNSFKTPAVARDDEQADPDALFLEKMYLIEKGLAMLDDMYRQFLSLRLDAKAWAGEKDNVTAWITHDISQGAA